MKEEKHHAIYEIAKSDIKNAVDIIYKKPVAQISSQKIRPIFYR
jgi:hypothetical protein